MNTKPTTSTTLICALLLPVAGYAADADTDRSSPKTFVKDSVITAKIKAVLLARSVKGVTSVENHIQVDTGG